MNQLTKKKKEYEPCTIFQPFKFTWSLQIMCYHVRYRVMHLQKKKQKTGSPFNFNLFEQIMHAVKVFYTMKY